MLIEERKSNYTDENGIEHELTQIIQVNEDRTEIIRATIDTVIPDMPQPEPEPTQLDRIEDKLNTTYTEAQQTAVDAYTEELLEGGIL